MSARRIIEGQAIVEDAWAHLDDEAPLPEAGLITVSRPRWLAQRAALEGRGDFGVRFTSAENPFEDREHLGPVGMVVLEFPKFADGRPFTYARLLRQQAGYRGRIRATGDVLRDQLLYMWRCGFDVFELREGRDLDDALAAFAEFTVDYQPWTPQRVG